MNINWEEQLVILIFIYLLVQSYWWVIISKSED